jgi:hypothetical protein
MGTHRGALHAGALCAIGALVAAVSCLGPTEVTLVITTDLPCSLNRGTSITVGGAAEKLGAKPPLTITQDCTLVAADVDDSGALTTPANVGTLVVVPSGGRSASFAVQIVTALDPNMSPMDCMQSRENCIIATREIAFIPHTPITLPIELTLDCKNIDCSQGETCFHGRCVGDTVQVACKNGGDCSGTIPPDASSPDVAGPPTDASTDSSARDAPVSDRMAMDQTSSDVGTNPLGNDATVQDATADATTDAPSESPPPLDGGPPSDASPLGPCVDANTSAGVECAGGRCGPGKVCCVNNQMLALPTETCTDMAACDVANMGYPQYWALSCRNWGDCPPGTVCCYQPTDAGSGVVATCVTSCSAGISIVHVGCQNSCECVGAGAVCNEKSCLGAVYGICGTIGGSGCP